MFPMKLQFRQLIFISTILLLSQYSFGQQPKYTFKHFVEAEDTTEYKSIYFNKDGFIRDFVVAHPTVLDIDDDSTTFIEANIPALLCFEGFEKNDKKEGAFNVYLIDSIDHSKKYRLWEQTYSKGKLNGQWKTYTLHGTLASFRTYKNDSLNGIAKDFWIDGKTVVDETEYFNGHNNYIIKNFYKNGKVESEMPYKNGKINGVGKKFYEDGTLKDLAEFKDDDYNGTRKYFYPNGQLWIEQTYKNGRNWNVIANYTDKGEKRNAGTLHDGLGTIIFYNEDGTIREVKSFKDGHEIN